MSLDLPVPRGPHKSMPRGALNMAVWEVGITAQVIDCTCRASAITCRESVTSDS